MCTQENSETPREASSCSSLGSTRKTLHFLQVPLWFWEFDIRSAAVQDISQEKQSSKVYLGKKKSDYRRKAVQNLNGFTWSIWTWLQTEWVAWWISLRSSGFQVHRCEYIKTENRFGNSDHNWKSEIPLLQKWKEMFGRPEQNTAFQHFLVSRNCQQYSVGSVEMFTERTIKSGWKPKWKDTFWLICIFWQDDVVSRIFTHVSHQVLSILWQSCCSLQTVGQFPQNDNMRLKTLSGESDKLNMLQTVRFLSWDFNLRAPLISRF